MTFLHNFFDANVFFASLPIGSGTKRTYICKNIACELTFSAQNNAIPAIAGVVNMAIIRNVLQQYHGGIRTGKAISLSNMWYRSIRKYEKYKKKCNLMLRKTLKFDNLISKRPQKSNHTGDFTDKYLVRSLRRKHLVNLIKIQKNPPTNIWTKNIR